MDYVGAGALLAIAAAMLIAVAWVSWSQRNTAGIWWVAAGAVIATDGLITATGQPAFLVPYSGDATGPFTAWLFYRGFCDYAERPPLRAAAVLAIVTSLAWIIMFNWISPDFTVVPAVIAEVILVGLAIRVLLQSAQTPLDRVLAAMCVLPIVLIALIPWIREPGQGRNAEIEIWVASIVPMALVIICALLERGLVGTRHTLDRRTEQLRMAAQLARMGTWSYHGRDGYVDWSDELWQIFDRPPDAGQPSRSAQIAGFSPEARERFRAAVVAAAETGIVVDIKLPFAHPDGETGYVHARGERIPSPDGVPVVVGTTLDITDSTRSIEELQRYRHQLEELVEQRTAELEESQQRLRHSERLASIGTLSAGLAHQVNNPVGSILAAASYARLCEGDPDEIATLRKGMLDIEAEARRCGEIVRGMLQFASDRPANKKQIAIDPLLESLRSVLRRSEAENAANLSVEYEGPSPLVLASAIELEQALANLIENAFQSSDSGSQVVLRRTTEHGQVRIEIRDDGRGITKEAVGHVLDPFYTSRLERGGTGLGLSVAHGVVRAHDGELRIESEVDVGTTVIVTLPLAR